ncbi:MAG: hypothetical protein K0S74_310 [Chlamydiales bacterium]|nr:hypothetical protein [Chlamydiales bacterium]
MPRRVMGTQNIIKPFYDATEIEYSKKVRFCFAGEDVSDSKDELTDSVYKQECKHKNKQCIQSKHIKSKWNVLAQKIFGGCFSRTSGMKKAHDVQAIKQNEQLAKIVDFIALGDVASVAPLLKVKGLLSYKLMPGNKTLLHWACINNQPEIAKMLVEMGLKKDSLDSNQNTPLFYACELGNEKLIKLVIDSKQQINAVNKFGETAIHVLLKRSQVSSGSLHQLLEKGAAIHLKDKQGNTPFHLACLHEHENALEILFEFHKEALLKMCNSSKQNLLHELCKSQELESIWKIQVIKLLLKHGFSINGVDEEGKSPLYFACEYGDLSLVKALIELGASSLLSTHASVYPIEVACRYGHEAVVEFLLNLNRRQLIQYDTQSLLVIACQNDSLTVVKFLLQVMDNVQVSPDILNELIIDDKMSVVAELFTSESFFNNFLSTHKVDKDWLIFVLKKYVSFVLHSQLLLEFAHAGRLIEIAYLLKDKQILKQLLRLYENDKYERLIEFLQKKSFRVDVSKLYKIRDKAISKAISQEDNDRGIII